MVRSRPAVSDPADLLDAEFDTLAVWTADVAAGLDPASRIPVGGRGSGGPGAMHWLLDRLRPEPGRLFLDSGAGVGGPAAFAAREAGVGPLLTDPQHGACPAARTLFGLPTLRAAGDRLPIAPGVVRVGWSLGVLCTVNDKAAFLTDVRRVLHHRGRFGLLVYCAAHWLDRRFHRAPDGLGERDRTCAGAARTSSRRRPTLAHGATAVAADEHAPRQRCGARTVTGGAADLMATGSSVGRADRTGAVVDAQLGHS